MKKILFCLLAVCTLWVGCAEEEEPISNTSMLTTGAWVATDVQTTPDDPFSEALLLLVYQLLEYDYDANGSYTLTTTQPDSAGNFSSGTGTWEFLSNETELLHDGGTDSEEAYDIITLNSDSLVYASTDSSGNVITITFEHPF